MISIEYIAGFFDGEGSIGIYRNGSEAFHLRTQLVQNDSKFSEEMARSLVYTFGGAICKRKHPHVVFNWQICSDPAATFLYEVAPHLIIKREQALLALGWQSIKQKQSRDENGRNKAHDHNRAIDIAASDAMKALKIYDSTRLRELRPDLHDALGLINAGFLAQLRDKPRTDEARPWI